MFNLDEYRRTVTAYNVSPAEQCQLLLEYMAEHVDYDHFYGFLALALESRAKPAAAEPAKTAESELEAFIAQSLAKASTEKFSELPVRAGDEPNQFYVVIPSDKYAALQQLLVSSDRQQCEDNTILVGYVAILPSGDSVAFTAVYSSNCLDTGPGVYLDVFMVPSVETREAHPTWMPSSLPPVRTLETGGFAFQMPNADVWTIQLVAGESEGQ